MHPGPKNEYPIQLLEKEIDELRQLSQTRTAPHGIVTRAKIVLLAHEHPEWSNKQIGQKVGRSERTVYKWRKRWTETKSLEDLPRPGAPRRFSP
jgi:transposase